MMYSETNLPRVLGALHDLLDELSSEIDLHYEDDELPGTTPTIEKMRTASEVLILSGMKLPEAYIHIQGRVARCAAA